eukprot:scaffold249_cov405-Prasinococcus_capsulatus_cf.AAC.2
MGTGSAGKCDQVSVQLVVFRNTDCLTGSAAVQSLAEIGIPSTPEASGCRQFNLQNRIESGLASLGRKPHPWQ